jgi:hypothetical protein
VGGGRREERAEEERQESEGEEVPSLTLGVEFASSSRDDGEGRACRAPAAWSVGLGKEESEEAIRSLTFAVL